MGFLLLAARSILMCVKDIDNNQVNSKYNNFSHWQMLSGRSQTGDGMESEYFETTLNNMVREALSEEVS